MKEKDSHLNENISARKIFLIDDSGEQLGLVSRLEALKAAEDKGLDLVQVAMQGTDVAVCRIMDYGKHLYEKKKKVQGQRKKQKQVHVKEIKFRPNTDVGDYQIKVNKIRAFLGEGDKVKVSIQFRGREMMHQDMGVVLLHRVEKDLQDVASVEQASKLEGRQMLMILAPKHTKT